MTPRNILLADDDKDDCLLFQEAIDEMQLPVNLTLVHNGEQLMHYLNNPKSELPCLLFLDLNMPRKNGLECLIEIKETERLRNLPVIIFSTSFRQEVINLLYEHGAQFYIRKPNMFSELKTSVQEALNTAEQFNYLQPPKEKFVLSIQHCNEYQ